MIWESNFYSALGKLENVNLQPVTAPLSKLSYKSVFSSICITSDPANKKKLVISYISITDMCYLELVSSA